MKVRADMVLKALRDKHIGGTNPDVFLTEVKNGSTYTNNHLLKMDAVAIAKSWSKPCITVYEVKVDRNDFLRDMKYPHYMQYCHKFIFACPTGLIKPEDLTDPTIGLVWYNPETGKLHTKKVAVYRPMEQLPAEMLMYIIMYRLDQERHPFFSEQRDYLELLVQDRAERQQLGKKVQG